nr:nucleotide disphospho-sugar-binding domain-containing protein [Arthrobacter sp. L77]
MWPGCRRTCTSSTCYPRTGSGGLIDAAVLHGGQGTVQTACATGVPFVGIGMQPEQAWNVAVCVRQGNAIAVSPRDAGTEHLAGAVQRLLTDGSFRAAAERERLLRADEDGPAAAARAIQRHLGPARSSG